MSAISGEPVGVNSADPFAIVPEIAQNPESVFVYFHGSDPNLPDENEAIGGMNECENWASSGRDLVTQTNTRSINPAIAAASERLYLAFELVTPGSPDDVHQIHFMNATFTCEFFIYMPVSVIP